MERDSERNSAELARSRAADASSVRGTARQNTAVLSSDEKSDIETTEETTITTDPDTGTATVSTPIAPDEEFDGGGDTSDDDADGDDVGELGIEDPVDPDDVITHDQIGTDGDSKRCRCFRCDRRQRCDRCDRRQRCDRYNCQHHRHRRHIERHILINRRCEDHTADVRTGGGRRQCAAAGHAGARPRWTPMT